jgi:dUTP pyrophosphatase
LIIETKLDSPKCTPLRANPSDAGSDLVSTTSQMLYPQQSYLFDTGISVKIPVGYVGLVVPRSSQGKVRVSIANTVGVIDSDYRGNIMVRLVNEGTEPYEVSAYATRIAQLIIMPIVLAQFMPTGANNWVDTDRGLGGFGSTGI